MRTQIIHLDHYDDFVSIRDKLMRVKSPHVFLIFPNHGSILDTSLDLLLLNRLARRLGQNLAIISIDKELVSRCDDFQISHFPSIKKAKSSKWAYPNYIGKANLKSHSVFSEDALLFRKRASPKKTSIFLKVGLISAMVISFSVFFLVIIPSATILLHPKYSVQRSAIRLSSSSIVGGSARSEFVPAFPLTRVISEAIVVTTSGSTIIPDGYATGSVRFENLTEDVVSVPSGTVVSTTSEPRIRYLTTEDGIIPAGHGEYVLIDVQAVRAGKEGNISSDEIHIVEGYLGSMVLVTNPTSIQGGTEMRVAAASDEDRLSAERDISDTIQKKCTSAITNAVLAGDILLGVSPTFEVITEEAFPEQTQPSEYFSLRMDASCLGWYARLEDILTLATHALDEGMPIGYQVADDGIKYEFSSIKPSGQYFIWEVSLERSITTAIDRENLVLQIIGKKQSKALKMIEEQYFLAEKPQVLIFPSWWPFIPIIASEISVEIKE